MTPCSEWHSGSTLILIAVRDPRLNGGVSHAERHPRRLPGAGRSRPLFSAKGGPSAGEAAESAEGRRHVLTTPG